MALRAWCRARTARVPSGFTIQVQVLDPADPSYRFDLEPPEVDDPEFAADKLSGLLGDLWLAEAESEQGGWLFARIDAAGRCGSTGGTTRCRIGGTTRWRPVSTYRVWYGDSTVAVASGSRRTWKGCTPPRDSVVHMLLRIFTEPQQGASYDDLLAVARKTEENGFDAFFRSDHYLAMG